MKRKGLIILLIMIAAAGLSAGDGWKDLFNGKNLKNFKVMGGKADFKVVDGVIVGTTKMNTPNSFLATKKTYGDFILEYEAKVDPVLNSGMQIRSLSKKEYQKGRVHGYQIEIDPSKRAWSGGFYEEGRRGWLYNLECNPQAKNAYKVDGWNHFRVEAVGSHFRVWLNGIPTADVIDDAIDKGFIAMQCHSINSEEKAGKTVCFKNVRIKTKDLEKELHPVTHEIPQVSYLNNELTEYEKAQGWKLLWDGKTTAGWRGAKMDSFPAKGWTMKDGVLIVEKSDGGESTNGGDIVTTDSYGDFELEVDFKITKGANSGIKYFVDTNLNKGQGSAIGCEFQILDDEHHPDAKKGMAGNRTLASLYDIMPANAHYYAPNESTPKRNNKYQWNRARVVVKGNHVEHYLNGIKVIDYERNTQTWHALVARSKYEKWPNFGDAERGLILLQDHGDEVHFRNIKIKTPEAGK